MDKVEEQLKRYGIDAETANFLCYVSSSHEPWFTESSSRKKFSQNDVNRLTNWLLEKKEEKGFI